jgi:phage gp46-like protein
MDNDACLQRDVGNRRIFWTTRPDVCGDYVMCGHQCMIPGLEYVRIEDEATRAEIGRTISNDEWVRGLILNIINTRARNDRPCPTPAAVYGHWSESFFREGEWLYIGSTLWNAAEKMYSRCQDAVRAIEAAVRADLGKLIAQGIVSSVQVRAVYHRQSHVDVMIDTVTSTGRTRIDLSGAFVSESWIWR